MKVCLQSLIIVFLVLRKFSNALRMIEVRVPNYTVKDNLVRLDCYYDIEDEKLYSVKWYKDGHEFYRYLPRDHPPATLFALNGITVDLHNSSDSIVILQSVNLASSGSYRCEVSGEAPSFNTVEGYGDRYGRRCAWGWVIESVYWKSNEERVMSHRQKASLLEVKKPVSSTTTDRVHATSSASKTSLKVLMPFVLFVIVNNQQFFYLR